MHLKSELRVPLDDESLKRPKGMVAQTASQIRDGQFKTGPTATPDGVLRCRSCDFIGFCGMKDALALKQSKSTSW